ncbi:MAG TPA: ImmA/IrrE family metallo-endopeptidase [Bradyrhizobium sp.]|nr:ImmA/IrrE family metallo-endopeptidase [Bradyrhizobium sp.]
MSLLRRGFRTWCENAARGYRRELGLEPFARLDPRLLASKLGVRIWAPHEVPGLPSTSLRQLTKTDPSNWSAVTICVADKLLVVINDQDSPERQNNSLAHELSHIVLSHKAAQVFVSPAGQMLLSEYDRVQEEEANCLSGTLLVPRDALLSFLSLGHDQSRIATHFAVTRDVLQMRINLTGVGKQLAKRRRYARG